MLRKENRSENSRCINIATFQSKAQTQSWILHAPVFPRISTAQTHTIFETPSSQLSLLLPFCIHLFPSSSVFLRGSFRYSSNRSLKSRTWLSSQLETSPNAFHSPIRPSLVSISQSVSW